MNKIHIGYPKTATTLLQRKIFPQLKEHIFIDHVNFRKSGLNDLIWKAERSIDYDALRKKYRGSNYFISFEDLVGPFFQGSMMIDVIPKRLELVFSENCQILITIRRQDNLLKSLYAQFIHQGGTLGFEDFLTWSIPGNNRIDLNAFNYWETHQRYSEIFGKENITVIPYELMRTERQKFISALNKFFISEKLEYADLEKVEYRSMKGFQLKLLRFINKFVKSRQSEKFVIPPSIISQDKLRYKWQESNFLRFGNTFSQRDEKAIEEVYQEFKISNRKIDDMLNLNLGDFGYY